MRFPQAHLAPTSPQTPTESPLPAGGCMARRELFTALAVVLLPLSLAAQDRQISGRVTQASTNQPIANAAVTVVGTSRTPARSDAEGRYTISAPAGDVRL